MSISSNINIPTLSVFAITVFIASIILDISPPEAIFVSSFSSSPIFVQIINITSSNPFLLYFWFSILFTLTLNLAFTISKLFNSLFIFSFKIVAYFFLILLISKHSLSIFASISFNFIFNLLFISSAFSINSISFFNCSLYSNISIIEFPYFLFIVNIVSNLLSISCI